MKKGISVVTLGIVLVILTIIIGIVVINSEEYIEEAKKNKFVTEYMLVESAVQKYYDNNQAYPIKKQNNVDATIVLTASSDADTLQFGSSLSTARTGIELKVVDISLLGYDDLSLGSGSDEKDFYGLSEQGVLYYVKGVKYNGKQYYKVTSELQ